MSRALKRNIAKHIKDKQKDNYPSLKKMSVSSFMKRVNMDIPDDSLPLEKINKFALLIKTLQFCVLIKSKNVKYSVLNTIIDRFIDTFKEIKSSPNFLIYKDTLLLADKRINVILKSINEDYDVEEFNKLDIPNMINDKIANSLAPFIVNSMQAYVGWYREEDEIFKGYSSLITDEEAREFQDELLAYSNSLDRKALIRSDNLIERLLNLNHKYTTIVVKKISNEIEEEINNLLSSYIHKEKEASVITNASNHFYKLLELRITFSAIYDYVLTKDDLRMLFRACYYYAIKKINDFLEVPEDLMPMVAALRAHSISNIIKLRIGNSFIENNEHLKSLLLTANLEVPTTGYILDSAVEAIVDKNQKLDIEEFKIKTWDSIKALILFIDSRQCNKLYRSTYAVDIESCKDTFFNILNGEYENNKEWFYKLLKKYDIFKMNKNYIAI